MLTQEVAAVIRALRTQGGISYEDLANVGVQRSISALEQAQVSISFSKLAELARVLDFDLVALVALCVSLQLDEAPQSALRRAGKCIDEFISTGGENLLKQHFRDGQLVKRPPGKPAKRDNASAVQKLKALGLSQAEAAQTLGLAKSTVNRYWREQC
jgi:transcriptional regulator with XRE-family HTH domain